MMNSLKKGSRNTTSIEISGLSFFPLSHQPQGGGVGRDISAMSLRDKLKLVLIGSHTVIRLEGIIDRIQIMDKGLFWSVHG